MTERLRPTLNRVLFISEENLQTMESWPLELRAIFDPRADVELAAQERQARQEAEARWARMREKYGDEIPF